MNMKLVSPLINMTVVTYTFILLRNSLTTLPFQTKLGKTV